MTEDYFKEYSEQAQEISMFLKKHEVALNSPQRILPKEEFLKLQQYCSNIKKSPLLLSKMSKEDLDILTTNTCYQIKGPTTSLAKDFLSKKSYFLFRDSLVKKNQNWINAPIAFSLFNVCMNHFDYSLEEQNTIANNLLTDRNDEDRYRNFKFLDKDCLLEKTQAVNILINVFKKLPDVVNTSKSYYMPGRDKVLQNLVLSLFHMNDKLTDKFIQEIPNLPEDSIILILKNSPAYHGSSNYKMKYSTNLQDTLEKFYDNFANPNKTKELFSALVRKWDEITSTYFVKTKIKDDLFFSLHHKNMNIFSSSINAYILYENASDKIKKHILSRVVYDYCDRTDTLENNQPSIPYCWEIQMLKDDDKSIDFHKIVHHVFNMKMPQSKLDNVNILYHFIEPQRYPLNETEKNDLFNSLESKFSIEKMDMITDYLIEHLGFSFFHDSSLQSKEYSSKMLSLALEKELLQEAPLVNTKRKGLKF